jgi:hypothetical protein
VIRDFFYGGTAYDVVVVALAISALCYIHWRGYTK